jgi:hypothetical protein
MDIGPVYWFFHTPVSCHILWLKQRHHYVFIMYILPFQLIIIKTLTIFIKTDRDSIYMCKTSANFAYT